MYRYPRLSVELSSKGYAILSWFARTFGGTVRKRSNREMWSWSPGVKDLAPVLCAILPHLRIKKAQARLALSVIGKAKDPETAAAKAEMHRLNAMPERAPNGAIALLVADRWVTPQMTLLGTSEPFSGPLPKSGSLRNGCIFAHRRSAPPTDASGCSVWPTASATPYGTNRGGSDAKDPRGWSRDAEPRPGLDTLARRWKTPHGWGSGQNGPDGTEFSQQAKRAQAKWNTPNAHPDAPNLNCNQTDKPGSIGEQAKRWSTPQAHDVAKGDPKRVRRYGTKHGAANLTDDVMLFRPGPPAPETPRDGAASSPSDQTSRRLSPRFTSWLMGLPPEYLELR